MDFLVFKYFNGLCKYIVRRKCDYYRNNIQNVQAKCTVILFCEKNVFVITFVVNYNNR